MNTQHINIGLARYSDWAFTSAVVALVVALLLLACELAFVRTRKLEPAYAGGVSSDSATPGVVDDTVARPFDERWAAPVWRCSTWASVCWRPA